MDTACTSSSGIDVSLIKQFRRYGIIGSSKLFYNSEHGDIPADLIEYCRHGTRFVIRSICSSKLFFSELKRTVKSHEINQKLIPILSEVVREFGSSDELPYRHCVTALLAQLDTEKDGRQR